MRLSIGLTVVLGLLACAQVQQDVNQAQASNVAAVTLLTTPAIPLLDGGSLPPASGLSVFFGNLPNINSLSAPTPIEGAQVNVDDSQGLSTSCSPQGNGVYLATSVGGSLTYDPGAAYTFTIVSGGSTYVANGNAPTPEDVPAFDSTSPNAQGLPVFARQAAGTDFVLTRNSPTGGKLNVAFVAVNSLGPDGSADAKPTWTNLPQTPLGLLQLVVDDNPWRQATVDIPGSAFPAAGLYLVSLTAVEEGGPSSNDLFLGSPVLIGSASGGLFEAN